MIKLLIVLNFLWALRLVWLARKARHSEVEWFASFGLALVLMLLVS